MDRGLAFLCVLVAAGCGAATSRSSVEGVVPEDTFVPQWLSTIHDVRWTTHGIVLATDSGLAVLDEDGSVRVAAPYASPSFTVPVSLVGGRFVLTSNNVLDLASGHMGRVIERDPAPERVYASPDDHRVVTVAEGALEVATDEGAVVATIPLGPHFPRVAMVPGGRVAVVDGDVLRMISLRDGAELWRVAGEPRTFEELLVDAGGALVTVGWYGSLRALDLDTGAELRRGAVPETSVMRGLLAPDGSTLLVLTLETGFLVDPATFAVRTTASFEGLSTWTFRHSPDGRWLVALRLGDEQWVLVDGLTGATVRELGPGASADFSPDSTEVVIASGDAVTRTRIDGTTEGSTVPLVRNVSDPERLAIAPAGAALAFHTGSSLGVLDPTTGALSFEPCAPGELRWSSAGPVAFGRSGACGVGGHAAAWILAISPDLTHVVDGEAGLRVRRVSGEVVAELALDEGETPPCSSPSCRLPVAMSDGAARVVVVRNATVRVFDGRTGALLARTELDARTAGLMSSRDGARVGYIGEGGSSMSIRRSDDLSPLWSMGPGAVHATWQRDLLRGLVATEAETSLVDLRGEAPVTRPAALPAGRVRWLGSDHLFVEGDDGTTLHRADDLAVVSRFGPGWLAVSDDQRVLAVCDGTLHVGPPDALVARGTCRETPGRLVGGGRFVVEGTSESLRLTRVADGARCHVVVVQRGRSAWGVVVRDDAGQLEALGEAGEVWRWRGPDGGPSRAAHPTTTGVLAAFLLGP